MKCLSYHTSGVIIGFVYLVISIFIFVILWINLITENLEDAVISTNDSPTIISRMIKCSIVQITCVLLIWGIVKRRPYFMIPWMIVSIIIFIFCFWFLFIYVLFLQSDPNFLLTIALLLLVVFQIFCYVLICYLFKIIKMENHQNPGIIRTDIPEVTYQAIEKD
ncbi:uncharacterized protein ACRADG_010676 [Cochliomyia hominivorax]